MKKEVIAHKDPKSPISEVFRTLRTNIQFMNVNKKMKVLLVTSTFPSEGKSWTASNLAVTFAQAGKKVVLIDSDMRKGRQYAIFGISPKPGLSNFLSEVEIDEKTGSLSKDVSDYIQSTEVENLYVMTAGTVPPNPSELLVSAQMIRLLDELKENCDIIIIDGTPSELVTDSVILSRIADSTVIVTAHKITKKDALERVVKNIKNVGGNIAGVIINKVPVSAKKYGEKYYYYGEDRSLSKRNNKSKKTKEHDSGFKSSLSLPNNDFETNTYNEFNTNKPQEEDMNSIKKRDPLDETLDFGYNDEIPRGLQNNGVVEQKTETEKISIEKTNDILNQINAYLEQEKDKM